MSQKFPLLFHQWEDFLPRLEIIETLDNVLETYGFQTLIGHPLEDQNQRITLLETIARKSKMKECHP